MNIHPVAFELRVKNSIKFVLHNSIFLSFFYILLPIVWALIFNDFLNYDWIYWSVRLIFFIFIPAGFLILMIGVIFGFKDTLLVISATIITVTITASTSVIIFDEQLLYAQLDPILIISILGVTFLVTISSIYRFYKYPEKILPELKEVKSQAESGKINFDLSGKEILQDNFFGDILSILNNINKENQKNFSKLKFLTNDLIQEKFRLKVILETISGAILVLKPNGNVFFANRKFSELHRNSCNKDLPNEFNVYDLHGTQLIDA
jgi:PAS domain-containing protein